MSRWKSCVLLLINSCKAGSSWAIWWQGASRRDFRGCSIDSNVSFSFWFGLWWMLSLNFHHCEYFLILLLLHRLERYCEMVILSQALFYCGLLISPTWALVWDSNIESSFILLWFTHSLVVNVRTCNTVSMKLVECFNKIICSILLY